MKINVVAVDVFKCILRESNIKFYSDTFGLSTGRHDESIEIADKGIIFEFSNGTLCEIKNTLIECSEGE